MDIHKLNHSSEQIQDVFDMAIDLVPSFYTENLQLSQYSESECSKLNLLNTIVEDNAKIEKAYQDLCDKFDGESLSQEELKAAIDVYFEENPIDEITEEEIKAVVDAYMEDYEPTTPEICNLPWTYYVDMLTTSRKIQKYEKTDKSDDFFIKVEGDKLTWYRGICTGETETLKDLFWVDAKHTAITTSSTAYPVNVYLYDERVRMEAEITDDETHGPKWTFGEGYGYDNPDQGKFYMEKLSDMMKMYLLNDANKEIGISISNNYTDITGLRKPTNIDYTDDGFTVTMDGGGTMAYVYTKDADGNVTAITDGVGHVTNITYTGAS